MLNPDKSVPIGMAKFSVTRPVLRLIVMAVAFPNPGSVFKKYSAALILVAVAEALLSVIKKRILSYKLQVLVSSLVLIYKVLKPVASEGTGMLRLCVKLPVLEFGVIAVALSNPGLVL